MPQTKDAQMSNLRPNPNSSFRLREISKRLAVMSLLALNLLAIRANAFSLLGPFAPWMDVQKGYRQPGDIGGPMNIGEGYRWNIPVITYGFSRSFLDYFGSNGVAAVESAIAIRNQVPPASAINPESYTAYVWR